VFQQLALPLLVLPALALSPSAQVSIREVCPSNVDIIHDEDGNSSDWIELWNQGTNPVDLNGWHLSDDATEPQKWTLPSQTLDPDARLMLWASGKGSNTPVTPRYHALITQGSIATYFPGATEPPATWRSVAFDDSAWSAGPSGFGYGDSDDATTVLADTIYIRHAFKLEPKLARYFDGLYLHVDYDDGFVAYLNGAELTRANLGAPGTHIPATSFATADHEAELYQGIQLPATTLAPVSTFLRPGTNVLAIQVHNISASSSDLSLSAFLTATTAAPMGELPNPALRFKNSGTDLPLHTNFRLSAEGEELLLSDASGQVVDQITFPRVYANTSFGRSDTPPLGPELLHFLDPTPNAPNTTEGRPGYAPAVSASPEGGHSPTGVNVSFSTTDPSLDIRYTRDCSEPDTSDPLFTTPIPATTQGATILRARAFETGLWPGPICTNTYLVNAEPLGDIPIFSLVTEPDNLWDWDTGIYVLGPNAGGGGWSPGANFWNDWERPLHVEFFETDGERKVSMDMGTKIHGGWSRTLPQKSQRLIARGGYGEAELEYAFFDDVDNSKFKTLLLRNSGNDFYFGNCRDPIIHLASEGTGIDDLAYRRTLVYLNGEYWGLMGLRERQDEDYLAYHHDVDPDRVDLLEINASVIEGSADHYEEMLDYLRSNDMSDDAHFAVVDSMMDTRNYAHYVAHQVWANNTDWPWNNIKFWRSQEPGSRWQWLLYDTDFGLGLFGGPYTANSLGGLFDPNGDSYWSRELFIELMQNQNYEEEFIRLYADLLNTSLSPATLLPVVDEVEEHMIHDMPDHAVKWNGSFVFWQSHMLTIRTFITNRPDWCRDHVRFQFQLAGMYDLHLDISPPGSGRIQLTATEIDGPFTGVYFLGVAVHAHAIPNAGYQFAGWSDTALSGAAFQRLTPSGDYDLAATFTPDGSTQIVFNELQYNPSNSADSGDWIELHNPSPQAATLDNWQLRDTNNTFTFPPNTTLAPGGYLVLTTDLAAFTTQFPTVTNVLGDLGFGLSGSGERIELHAPTGLHDFVEYDDSAPWPPGPDGNGTTLELIDATTDNALATSWAESTVLGGTPGEQNSVTP
jgi:hypothetical protein